MSLSFSIDRILSPDFGPCKSRALDSTIICSGDNLPVDNIQSMCKSEEFSYKKLVADRCKQLEMAPSTEMSSGVSLISKMMAAFPSHSVRIKPDSNSFNNERVKLDVLRNELVTLDSNLRCGLIRNTKQADLDGFHANLNCMPFTLSSEKLSTPLTQVANFVEDIFNQKVNCDKHSLPLVDFIEQSNSLKPFRINLSGEIEQSKPSPVSTMTFPTKEISSSPKNDERPNIQADIKDIQTLTKPHLEEDNFHAHKLEISCDTKPQVPEELCQKEDRCSSSDGRCSSSSIDTLSSMAENDSNHAITSSGLFKPSLEEGNVVIKESLSDAAIDSPPPIFSDNANPKLMSDDLDEIIPPREGWPVWVYCSRYSARPSSGPRSRRQSRKVQSSDEKRCRTAFTMYQLNKLHTAFENNPYLCEKRRNELARDLQLSESQVKIWFQNRRAKVKKASGSKNKLAALLKEQGLYNHSTTKT